MHPGSYTVQTRWENQWRLKGNAELSTFLIDIGLILTLTEGTPPRNGLHMGIGWFEIEIHRLARHR